MALRDRVTQDKKMNAYGNDLRDLCISSGLCILNGRTIGDMQGKYTYIGPQGCSVVDYALASKVLRKNILSSFEVENLGIFSDHRPITVTLATKVNKTEVKSEILGNVETRSCALKYDESQDARGGSPNILN